MPKSSSGSFPYRDMSTKPKHCQKFKNIGIHLEVTKSHNLFCSCYAPTSACFVQHLLCCCSCACFAEDRVIRRTASISRINFLILEEADLFLRYVFTRRDLTAVEGHPEADVEQHQKLNSERAAFRVNLSDLETGWAT